MKVTTVGVDLAKNVFQVHGIDEHGKVLAKKQLRRDQMAGFFVNLPPCLIGMEACGSAHHWARKLQTMGHTVRLMAPQFVKPYVKTNKNDAADAEAILRGSGPAEHALRADQECRATVGAGSAPSSPGFREGAHSAGQSNSRPSR